MERRKNARRTRSLRKRARPVKIMARVIARKR